MRRPAVTRALIAAALTAAVLLRWLLDPVLGDQLPLVTLYGAVAAAVWLGGYVPAVAVSALGFVACDFLFIPPRGTLVSVGVSVVGLVAYLFTCAIVIAIGEAMRRAQQRASERGELMRVTLGSIGDAVITTDPEGRVSYLNAVAESLTGWRNQDAIGRPLDTVFRIVNEETRRPVENPALRALREGAVIGLANHTTLIARDGVERAIDDSAAPIRDDAGHVSGSVLIFRDISERRRWERDEADRLATARQLASIVESSDDAIVRKSLDGTIQSWNAAAERVFGYSASEAIGRHISLIIPGDRLAEEDEIIARLKAGERVDHFETERRHSSGQPVWVSLTISPIRDERGRVVGASKIARDVTRQREVVARELQLRDDKAAADAKFHAFFEQGALFAGILDLEGTVLDANQLWCEGCGFARDQVVGRKFWDGPWWAPSAALVEQVKAACARAAAGEAFRGELSYFVADGSRRMVDGVITPIKDAAGRVLYLAPSGADITDRKRAEDERQKLVTLVENSTDFIGLCDLEGIPFFINRAGLQMVGLESVEQASRTHVREFFLPEDQSRIMDEFFPAVMASGHGEIDVRFRHFQTGEPRWMAYKVIGLKDGDGHVVAFATVSQDITERRKLADDLRKLAADLSAADRQKNEFLATLAHELRSPLAPLGNMLEVLKRTDDAAARHIALATMERQLQQMVRLVDDLLDLNRITLNRLELRKAPVDLHAVIAQAVEASRPLADTFGHRIRVLLPEIPMPLNADSVRLTQVFGNLLNNSCKYTDPGGTITVRAETQGGDVVVTVEDTGAGIPPDRVESIFDMFTQIDRSLERSQGGLGIGLTLVRRLVQMHGGSVEARSAGERQGSQFIVRLPIAAHAAVPPARAAAASAHGRRILVVDDNRDAASSLAMLLQIEGNEVVTAHDGAAAFATAAANRPDVVLLDIGLPVLNGYEVCRKIRREPWGTSMMLIALTGWGQDQDRHRSREAGFDGHLVKPVNFADLTALLGSLKIAG